MNQEKLRKNIIDQIQEAQVKLGYEKETTRLYYPPESISAIAELGTSEPHAVIDLLREAYADPDPDLGELKFRLSAGRIEVSVPPEGAEYVHDNVPVHPFLVDLIDLFRDPHHLSIESIHALFAKYDSDYIGQKMPEGTDFDYVFRFPDDRIDAFCYCVKEEMGHVIYHRFTYEDYLALL